MFYQKKKCTIGVIFETIIKKKTSVVIILLSNMMNVKTQSIM